MEDKISSIADVQAIEAEIKVINQGLVGIMDNLRKITGEIVSLHTSIKSDKSFDELSKSAEKYNTAIRSVSIFEKEMTKLEENRIRLGVQLANAKNTEAKADAELKARLADRNRELRAEAEMTVAAEKAAAGYADVLGRQANSIRELNEQNKQLRQIRDALDTKTQADDIQRLNTVIDANTAVIELNQDKYVQQKMNIGNYQSALNGLKQQLLDSSEAMQQMAARGDTQSEEYKTLQQNVTNVTAEIDKFKNEMVEATKDAEPMKTQLKALKQEAQELSVAMQNGTASEAMIARFHEVSEQGAVLQDTIDDVQARFKALASDTHTLDSMVDGVNLVVSSFQVWKGAMQVLGMENQEFEKTLRQLQGAQALVNGLTTIANKLQKESALMTKLQMLSESKLTTVRVAATFAQRALNAAQKAMPIMLLVSALAIVGKALFDYSNKADKASNSSEQLSMELKRNEDFSKDYGKEMAKQYTGIKKLQTGWQELGGDMQKQKRFVVENKDAFKQLGVQVSNVEDAENLLVKNTDKFLEAMNLRAKSIALSNLAVKEYEKAFEILASTEKSTKIPGLNESDRDKAIKSLGFTPYDIQGDPDAEKKIKAEMNRLETISKELSKSSITAISNTILDEGDALNKMSSELKNEAYSILKNAGIKEVSQTETNAKNKFDAQKKYADLAVQAIKDEEERKLQIRDLAYSRDKEELKKNFKDKNNLTKEEQKALADLEEIYLRDIGDIRSEANEKSIKESEALAEKQKKIKEDLINKAIENSVKEYEAGEQARAEALAKEEAELAGQYSKGLLTKEEYEKAKDDLTYKYSQDAIKAEINNLETFLKANEITGDTLIDIKKKISDATIALLKGETAHTEKEAEKQNEIRKKQLDIAKDLAKEAFGMAVDFLTKEREAKVQAYDEELERVNSKKERDLEILDESVMSDETRAAETKRINEQAKADSDKLEAEKRKEQEKSAAFQKAASITQALINTALAVTSALATPPFPVGLAMSISAGILGAAQVAMIASQPLPKYFMGTDNHPGGLAIVGDGGKREYIQTPTGSIFETPSTPTLIDMAAGSQVFPSYHELVRSFKINPQDQATNTQAIDFDKGISRLEKTIAKNKSIQVVNLDNNGIWVVANGKRNVKRKLNRNTTL